MAGVIVVMKSSLEPHRMYGSRVLLGSVAASAAMFCLLSLSSAAVISSDGAIDRSYAQAQCCSTVDPGAPIAGGLLVIARTDHYRGRASGASGEARGQKYLTLGDTRLVGAALSTDNAPAGAGAPASGGSSDGSSGPDATNGATPDVGSDAVSTDSAAGEFTGSPDPSGPDLNSTEEKDLISSGWK
jgi:hypothetical protein